MPMAVTADLPGTEHRTSYLQSVTRLYRSVNTAGWGRAWTLFFSLKRLEFSSRAIRMGFAVDKVKHTGTPPFHQFPILIQWPAVWCVQAKPPSQYIACHRSHSHSIFRGLAQDLHTNIAICHGLLSPSTSLHINYADLYTYKTPVNSLMFHAHISNI